MRGCDGVWRSGQACDGEEEVGVFMRECEAEVVGK